VPDGRKSEAVRVDDFQISTEPLILRRHRLDDVDFMVELNSDPQVVRYTSDSRLTRLEAAELVASLHQQFADRKIGRFLVVERTTATKIGWCGLKWLHDSRLIELGYRFSREQWGKGYATEAAAASIEYGFEALGFERIIARVAPDNAASMRVLQKLGMQRCGSGVDGGLEYLEFMIRKKPRLP
jgi:RimJ/RimL family protein N-acetyltransferase